MSKYVFKARVKTRCWIYDIIASLKNITGGRVEAYEKIMEECAIEAYEELKKEHGEIKNLRLMTTELMPGAAELIVYGEVD